MTTSWDDGDALDERLAELLDRYGVKATFYVAPAPRPHPLSHNAIRELSSRHEIGAHSLTHPDLRKLSRSDKLREIGGSKTWLEDIIGQEVTSFCYPFGRFDAESADVVRASGFARARTVVQGEIAPAPDPFAFPTTLQVYPMPFRKSGPDRYDWPRLLRPIFNRAPALRKLGVPWASFRSWDALAVACFEIARARGHVFHLWGHSWEIDLHGMWTPLERFLRHIAGRSDCRYVPNAALNP